MDIVDRLTAFRDYTGLTNSQFADRAGIPRPTLSQFLSGRNKRLSDDFTAKLHNAYPELNVLWLLFGEGDMLVASNIEFSESKNSDNSGLNISDSSENEKIDKAQPPYSITSQTMTNQPSAGSPGAEIHSIPSNQPNQQLSSLFSAAAEAEKKIQSIMVFYTDNSYEAFYPAPSGE